METRHINQITPYDKNPRKNTKAVDYVLESLKKHGQVKPIVISAAGKPFGQEVICAGHTTYEALKRFGASEIKVVVKDFADEEEFVDYNIRDNKSSEYADWDEAILEELSSQFDIDLRDMDFEFTGNLSDDNLGDLGSEEGLPVETDSELKPGQIWSLNDTGDDSTEMIVLWFSDKKYSKKVIKRWEDSTGKKAELIKDAI